jgi:hypothetical protein
MKIIAMACAVGFFLAGLAPAAPTVSNVVATMSSYVAGPRGMFTRTFDVMFDLANTNGQACRIFPGVRGVARNPVLTDEGPYLWYKNLSGDTAAAAGTNKHITFTVKDTAGEFVNVRVKITAWDREGSPPWPNRSFNPRWHALAQDVSQGTVHPRSRSFTDWIKTNSSGAFLSILKHYTIYTVMGNHGSAIPTIAEGQTDRVPVPLPAVSLGDPFEPTEYATCSGDCILEILDVENWVLYNMYSSHKNGSGPYDWGCDNLSVFPYYSETYTKKGAVMVPISGEKPSTVGAYRTLGWTSSSASGLGYSTGYVTLDEMNEGEIHHALRFETLGSRPYYVHPASHCAGSVTDTFAPPAGLRIKLKGSWDINAQIPLSGTPGSNEYRDSRAARIVLRACQKYGLIWEDNCGYGGGYITSESDDHRDIKWTNLCTASSVSQYLYTTPLSLNDFEVVDWKWQYAQYAHYDSLYNNR